ncbi:MAG: cysteine hydrolase [Deltaproteobacteria bacterium]|nr:cysteine hydrolase [Deltaproteobacteria bacterium]
MEESRPEVPKPQPIILNSNKSALLVLDISERCVDPDMTCHELAPRLKAFIDRARAACLPIIYSISARLKGTPEGEVYSLLERRPSEPVIYPDSFDKFAGGEMQSFLALYDVDTLIVTGYRANICVLHTAVTATRDLKYRVVMPIDGIAAKNEYEKEYALIHFSVLPLQASRLFTFSTLEMIGFKTAWDR